MQFELQNILEGERKSKVHRPNQQRWQQMQNQRMEQTAYQGFNQSGTNIRIVVETGQYSGQSPNKDSYLGQKKRGEFIRDNIDNRSIPNGFNQGNYQQGNYQQGNYQQGNYQQGNYQRGNYQRGAYRSRQNQVIPRRMHNNDHDNNQSTQQQPQKQYRQNNSYERKKEQPSFQQKQPNSYNQHKRGSYNQRSRGFNSQNQYRSEQAIERSFIQENRQQYTQRNDRGQYRRNQRGGNKDTQQYDHEQNNNSKPNNNYQSSHRISNSSNINRSPKQSNNHSQRNLLSARNKRFSTQQRNTVQFSQRQKRRVFTQKPDTDAQSDFQVDENKQIQQESESASSQKQGQQNDGLESVGMKRQLYKQESNEQLPCVNNKCSSMQFTERLKVYNQNQKQINTFISFGIFEINKRTNEPDESLALQRFRRSSNSTEYEGGTQSDYRRSAVALIATIKHINKQIIDCDRMSPKQLAFPLPPEGKFQFIHLYEFFQNRMRKITNDISCLSDVERRSQPIIAMSEEMLRFFIISLNQCLKKSDCTRIDYDRKANENNIKGIIGDLNNMYQINRFKLRNLIQQMKAEGNATVEEVMKAIQEKQIYISPNQPQIVAYSLLFSREIQREISDKLISNFNNNLQNPLFSSEEVQFCLNLTCACSKGNYEKFFLLLQDEKTDYVMACMSLLRVEKVRKQILRKVVKASIPDNSRRKIIPLAFLQHLLRFKDDEDSFKAFLQGGECELVEDTVVYYKIDVPIVKTFDATYYEFDKDKTKRSLWTQEIPSKNVQNKQNFLTREELVTRSWHTSDYPRRLIQYYIGQDFTQSIVEIKPVQQNAAKNNQQMDKLKVLYHKIKRSDFLNKFQQLIKNLLSTSTIMRNANTFKTLQTICELLLYLKKKTMQEALNAIKNHCLKKEKAKKAFEDILFLANKRKQYMLSQNKTPYEWIRNEMKNKDPRKMSEVIENAELRQFFCPDIRADLYNQCLRACTPTKQDSFISVKILMLYNPVMIGNKHQIISQIWKYFTQPSQQNMVQVKRYLQFTNEGQFRNNFQLRTDNESLQVHYDVTLMPIRIISKQTNKKASQISHQNIKSKTSQTSYENIPFINGYHSVFFISYEKDLFKQIPVLITKYQAIKQVLSSSKKSLTQLFSVIHICDGECSKIQCGIKQYWYQAAAKQIPVSFKWCITSDILPLIINKALSMSNYHSFKICSFSDIFQQIKNNLFIVSNIRQNEKSQLKRMRQQYNNFNLLYYQTMFNICIQKVKKFVDIFLQNYELEGDWIQILKKLNGRTEESEKKKKKFEVDYNLELVKQAQYLRAVLSDLNLTLFSDNNRIKRDFKAILSDERPLECIVEAYLSQFSYTPIYENTNDIDRQSTIALLIQMNCSNGQYKPLIEFLLDQLCSAFKEVFCIIPCKGFINITAEDIQQRCRKEIQRNPLKQKSFLKVQSSFIYQRTIQLQTLRKKVKRC